MPPVAVHRNASIPQVLLLKPKTTELAFTQKERKQYLVLRISILRQEGPILIG